MALSTVNVTVRIRPYCCHELEDGSQSYATVVRGKNKIQVADAHKSYRFDHVSGPETDNEKFYSSTIRNTITEIFNERDVTIIAYGNRGSGKTWTMGTNYRAADQNMGIIPRAIDDIFTVIDSDSDHLYRVTVTFVELYNKQLYDLLSARKEGDERIVEITSDRTKVRDLTEKQVSSVKDALQYLIQGSQERVNSEKKTNSRSSRSHGIFTISINQQKNGDPRNAKRSKLHLVDLAGTKRGKKSMKKDNATINKNLLAVGRMINQLQKGKSDLSIKYQENKLSIYLRESLRGNSITMFIGCISPADCNRIETLDTLRYANRLRKMKSEIIESETEKESNEISRGINTDNSIVSELNLGREVQISSSSSSQEWNTSCKTELENIESVSSVDSSSINDWETSDLISEPSLTEQKKLQKAIVDNHEKIGDEMIKFNTKLMNNVNVQKSAKELEKKPNSTNSMVAMILEQFQDALSYKNENLQAQEFMLRVYTKIQNLLDEQNKFTKNMLKSVVIENDTMDEENVELLRLQMQQYYEGQALEPYIALLEELVSLLIKESAPIGKLVKDLEDTKYKINVLESEKLDIVQVLTYTESYKENWTLAKVAMKKIADMDVNIWKFWAQRMKQTMDIERREKFDQQISNILAQIEMLKRARQNVVEDINKDTKNKMNLYGDVINTREKQKQRETIIRKKAKKKTKGLMSPQGGSSGGDIHCGCKASGCVSRRCSCYRNELSCTNCNCNSKLCQNSDKKNNLSNVSRESSSLPSNTTASGHLNCACKFNCSSRKCGCRKNGEICNDNCKCNSSICENKNKENDTTSETSFIVRPTPKRSTDGKVKNDCADRCSPVDTCLSPKNKPHSFDNWSCKTNLCVLEVKRKTRRRLFSDTEHENEGNEDPRKRPRLEP